MDICTEYHSSNRDICSNRLSSRFSVARFSSIVSVVSRCEYNHTCFNCSIFLSFILKLVSRVTCCWMSVGLKTFGNVSSCSMACINA
jgi:hypothetical protein